MSTASQFFGGGGNVQIGGMVVTPFSDVLLSSDGKEYLRGGCAKSFDASYADAIVACPGIRVFGSNTKTKGSETAGTVVTSYAYIGTKYVCNASGGQAASSTDLVSWTLSGKPIAASAKGLFLSNGTYLVAPSAYSATEHAVTTDGSTWADVGGSFGTHPIKTLGARSGNTWMYLSSLGGIAGEVSYIINSNPSGAWTVNTATATGGTTYVNGMAANDTYFVVTQSGSGAAAKLFTSLPSAPSVFTDRTSAIGLANAETIAQICYDGTVFVIVTSYGRVLTAADPTGTWTVQTMAFPNTTYKLSTDGAGTIIACGNSDSANVAFPMFYTSTDHGATWMGWCAYCGKAPRYLSSGTAFTMNFVNGRWLENHSGAYQNCQDLGASGFDSSAPDYVGIQHAIKYALTSTTQVTPHWRIK